MKDRLKFEIVAFARLLGLGFAFLLFATGSEAADRPISFTAKAVKSGGRNIRIYDGATYTKVEVSGKTVEVDIRSSKPPSSPYLVECFFFARYQANGEEWIYDVARADSAEQFDEVLLESVPLRGRETSESRMEVWFADGSREVVVTEEAIAGDKVSGWVARCRSEGETVAMKASSTPLLKFAEESEALLDEILLDFYPVEESKPAFGYKGTETSRAPSGIRLPTPERVWKSTDGKELRGQVTEIDPEAGTVTLVRSDGVKFENFAISDLHPDDRWVLLGDPVEK